MIRLQTRDLPARQLSHKTQRSQHVVRGPALSRIEALSSHADIFAGDSEESASSIWWLIKRRFTRDDRWGKTNRQDDIPREMQERVNLNTDSKSFAHRNAGMKLYAIISHSDLFFLWFPVELQGLISRHPSQFPSYLYLLSLVFMLFKLYNNLNKERCDG